LIYSKKNYCWPKFHNKKCKINPMTLLVQALQAYWCAGRDIELSNTYTDGIKIKKLLLHTHTHTHTYIQCWWLLLNKLASLYVTMYLYPKRKSDFEGWTRDWRSANLGMFRWQGR